ncbi:MAG: hypothetical protein MI717_00410 [Spirochaetales bacterium]|nr:hypothetical protein [Spirochaetales bacterium]
MKLAFCVKSAQEGGELDQRFGRAAAYALVDGDSGKELQRMANPHKEASSSAGVGAVQMLSDAGVLGIVGPKMGPKALDALRALGLEVWDQGELDDLGKAYAAWAAHSLPKVDSTPKPAGLYRA